MKEFRGKGFSFEEFVNSEEGKRFRAHLVLDEDSLGLVVRGHLYVEARLTDLIEQALHKPEKLRLAKKSFALKVELAVAMGVVDAPLEAPLKLLNNLRNKFSHNLEAEIARPEGEALYKALPVELQGYEDLLYKGKDLSFYSAADLFRITIMSLFGYMAGMLSAAYAGAPIKPK